MAPYLNLPNSTCNAIAKALRMLLTTTAIIQQRRVLSSISPALCLALSSRPFETGLGLPLQPLDGDFIYPQNSPHNTATTACFRTPVIIQIASRTDSSAAGSPCYSPGLVSASAAAATGNLPFLYILRPLFDSKVVCTACTGIKNSNVRQTPKSGICHPEALQLILRRMDNLIGLHPGRTGCWTRRHPRGTISIAYLAKGKCC